MKQSRKLGQDPRQVHGGDNSPGTIQGVRLPEVPAPNIGVSVSDILRQKGIDLDADKGGLQQPDDSSTPTSPASNTINSEFSQLSSPASLSSGNTSEALAPKSDSQDGGQAEVSPSAHPSDDGFEGIVLIPQDQIDTSPYQPRIKFDEKALIALADTIQDDGLNNPVLVRRKEDGRYELIGGERRLRAFRLLRKPLIAAIVRNVTEAQAAVMATTDNDAREDLTDYERGRSYARLLADKVVQNQLELSRRVGRSNSTVSRCLAYLKLPQQILDMLDKNPDLVGTKIVADLVAFADDGHKEKVIEAVTKIKDGNLSQENALNWLKGEIRRLTRPTASSVPRSLLVGETPVADIKVDGRKLILQCPKGVNPEDLLSTLKKALEEMGTSASMSATP